MKYSHIEARTNVNIPTHLGKPVITKYEPDNPLHDPTTTTTLYSIYGKRREDGIWVCLVDTYEYPIAHKITRTLSDFFQASYSDENLIDIDFKQSGGVDDKPERKE